MVRQVSQRIATHSPRLQRSARANRVAPVPKSPLASKGFHAKRTRLSSNTRSSALANRYQRNKRPILPTILEEDEEEDVFVRPNRELYRELDKLEAQSNDEDDGDGMDWDEETTLVALLQDDRSDVSDTEELAALADKLKAPMSAQGQQLKRYMAETIIPAVQRVKIVHEKLDEEVDMAYGTGLLAFNEVCKRVETMALQTEDEIRTEYIESKKLVDSLVSQLTDAYRQRDLLWSQLEDDLASCAARAKSAIEALPGDVETSIAKLEKKWKDTEKSANSSASKQKILKDMLAHL